MKIGNFDDVMKNSYIDTYFQPIVGLIGGHVIGYEALSRGPRDTDLYMPNALITEAKVHNRLDELDHLLRKTILLNAAKRGLRRLLFINIDPMALYDDSPSDNTVRRCADFGIPPHRVVVEVSGRNAMCSFEKFRRILCSYKSEGFQVACDDIDSPLPSISAMSSLNPDFIKIDGRFVHGIDKADDNGTKVELGSIISIAKMIKAKVVAVGVETGGELETLYRMGVDAAQGNLIGMPKEEFEGVSQKVSELIEGLGAVGEPANAGII